MAFKCGLVILCVLTASKAHEGYQRDYPSDQLSYNQNYGYEDSNNYSDQWHGDEIPGVAGRDYPIFHEVPQTQFDCQQQQYPGYYADPEANCQAFHICQTGGHKDSFLCPNGTLFNQERLVCEWWANVDCSQAVSFYSVNEVIVRAMQEADRLTAERRNSVDRQYGVPSNQNGQQNGYRNGNQRQPDNKYLTPAIRQSENSSIRGINHRESSNAAPLRPIYGVPDITANSVPQNNGHYDNSYASRQNFQVTGVSFGKQGSRNHAEEPNNIYLPA